MVTKWDEARRRLLRLAGGRTGPLGPNGVAASLEELPRSEHEGEGPLAPRAPPSAPRAASLCVASGKGGTGKSVVSASLATSLAARGRTLILDADMGVGNAHILQDVSPLATLVDVVEGETSLRDARIACSSRIDLLAAGSGVPRMSELSKYETYLIAEGLEELELEYRWVVVDSAAGISRQTLRFALACDVVLIVTTPDLTAMTDAYALLKSLRARRGSCMPLLLVNRAWDQEQAEEVASRIARVAERFLGTPPRLVGWLPEDPVVPLCVNRRGAVSLLEPASPFARALSVVAARLDEELAALHARGMGRTLLEEIDYPAHLS
jgi:flagellar biosynthesis protein FlhG